MWPFKKKKAAPPPPCNHKWKDFDPYVEASWDVSSRYAGKERGDLHMLLIEPYVCVWCKKRENRVLVQAHWFDITEDAREAHILHWEDQYGDLIKPKGKVEDKVQDFIMLDPPYLEAYDRLHPQ